MDQRYATNPQQLTTFNTNDLRSEYLVENLFVPGEITACYTHHDRVVIAGAAPAGNRCRCQRSTRCARNSSWPTGNWE